MAISRLTERKFRAICYYIFSWMVAGSSFTFLRMYANSISIEIFDVLFTLQLSIFIGLSHGIYDVVVLQDDMDHRTAGFAMFVRSIYYVSSTCLNFILCTFLFSLHDGADQIITEDSIKNTLHAFREPHNQVLIVVFFVFGHLITFIRSVHKKFGSRVFINTLLGKSQDPTEEDLIFMFIDLRNSTHIAEELGHMTYSNFMKDYYKLLSNCCAENHGDTYQIAGDGAFITWKTESCKTKARALNCFYDFTVCMERTRTRFLRKYGVAPTFKAGAHCGKVISTEVGNFGSEMAYHGDVLNTTSRIQSMCGTLDKEFLVSEELYNMLPKPLPHGFIGNKEGYYELKGKKNEILIFSLTLPLTSNE